LTVQSAGQVHLMLELTFKVTNDDGETRDLLVRIHDAVPKPSGSKVALVSQGGIRWAP
jgi:hypothetical protein